MTIGGNRSIEVGGAVTETIDKDQTNKIGKNPTTEVGENRKETVKKRLLAAGQAHPAGRR